MELFKRTKNNNLSVLRQIINLIPAHLQNAAIAEHKRDKHCSVSGESLKFCLSNIAVDQQSHQEFAYMQARRH